MRLDQISLMGLAAYHGAPSYRSELLALHKSIANISSISGNEVAVGEQLLSYLKGHNFNTARQAVPLEAGSTNPSDRRFNVMAWSGDAKELNAKVLVSSHIDVVPPFIEYSIEHEGDAITDQTLISGRGTVDAKASVAAMIVAVEELEKQALIAKGAVGMVFVVGEETGGYGMTEFNDSLPPTDKRPFDAVIFGEPTENKLVCGHKGSLACNITAHGKAAHSAYPEYGKNANEMMARAVVEISKSDLGSSELYGNTTFNTGVWSGGLAANIVPDKATLRVLARVAIGTLTDGHLLVKQTLQEILDRVDKGGFELDCPLGRGPVECECNVDGFERDVVNYGTDIPRLNGIYTKYLYGPGNIRDCHAPQEGLTVGELETAVEGYKQLILHALGNVER